MRGKAFAPGLAKWAHKTRCAASVGRIRRRLTLPHSRLALSLGPRLDCQTEGPWGPATRYVPEGPRPLMNALAQALSQPATLILVALAFGLGFLVRGIGVNAKSPPILTQAQVEDALSRVTKARWAEIDRAIDDRKKLLAIKLLREQTGLGLKASKEAIEARMQSRHRMRG